MEKTEIAKATEKGQEYGCMLKEPLDAPDSIRNRFEKEMLTAGWTEKKGLLKELFDVVEDKEVKVFVLGDRLGVLQHVDAKEGENDIKLALVELEESLKNAIKRVVRRNHRNGYDRIVRSMDLDADYVFDVMNELGWHKVDAVPEKTENVSSDITDRCYFENKEMYAVVGKGKQTPVSKKLTTILVLVSKNYHD